MKWLLIVLMIVQFALTGCGGDPPSQSPSVDQPEEIRPTEPAPTEPPLPDIAIDNRENAMAAAAHQDLRIRWQAVLFIKEQSDKPFADLKELLNSEYEDVVCAAVNGLKATGPEDEVITLLIEAANHHRAAVRTEAVINLGEMGAAAVRAVPAIEAALQSDDARLREKAQAALDKIKL